MTDRGKAAAGERRRERRIAELLGRVDTRNALVVAAGVAAVTLIAIATPIAVSIYGVPLLPAFALVILHAASLPIAVVRPVLGASLSLIAAFALQAWTAPSAMGAWPWWVVLIIIECLVLLVVALRGDWRISVVTWFVASAAPVLLAMMLRPDQPEPQSVNLVVFASIAGGVVAIGVVIAQWRSIRSQLVRERSHSVEEHALRMLAEDRARIAREVHDVIAHGLSIITVQATTARYRLPELPASAVAELDDIANSSREALGQMRSLLEILRADGPEKRTPQPRLSDISELVAQASRAGADVELRFDGPTDQVSDVLGLVAYRIVQEGLSNAIRHAPGARISVSVESSADLLVIRVENDAAPQQPRSVPGSGFGIVGMRERATSVAGLFTSGAREDGGYVIHAALPLTPPQSVPDSNSEGPS